MPVKQLARPRDELVSAAPDTSIRDLCSRMDDRKVGCVVIESEREPAGIVTDRDVAMAFGRGEDLENATAADLMIDDPHTASADDGVFDLCATMAEHGVRRMPVVEDGELTGIITFDDLIVLLDEEMGQLGDVVRAESPPYEGD